MAGCVSDKAQLGNINSSDLVTFVSALQYKGQDLAITTRVWAYVFATDQSGAEGGAQGSLVCYADRNDASASLSAYRCNVLAKRGRPRAAAQVHRGIEKSVFRRWAGLLWPHPREPVSCARAVGLYVQEGRQVVLQQSVASEAAGGIALRCFEWRGLQVFTDAVLDYYNGGTPCLSELNAPYAVMTFGAKDTQTADMSMTIYNGADDSSPRSLEQHG